VYDPCLDPSPVKRSKESIIRWGLDTDQEVERPKDPRLGLTYEERKSRREKSVGRKWRDELISLTYLVSFSLPSLYPFSASLNERVIV
jgi:hypothetical protein